MTIMACPMIPAGFVVLLRGGVGVWVGPIDAPIEDAEADTACLNPADYERIIEIVARQNQ